MEPLGTPLLLAGKELICKQEGCLTRTHIVDQTTTRFPIAGFDPLGAFALPISHEEAGTSYTLFVGTDPRKELLVQICRRSPGQPANTQII